MKADGNIWTPATMAMFLAFFIPGFISVKIWELLVPTVRRNFTDTLAEIVGFSALNWVVFSWWIADVYASGTYLYILRPGSWQRFGLWLMLFASTILAPALWPLAIYGLLVKTKLSKYVVQPVRTPWDVVFGRREPFWVLVTLKDGGQIRGLYGENSHAAVYPEPHQIYLEKAYQLDPTGGITSRDDSRGIIVMADEISSLELWTGPKKEKSDGREENR